MQKQILSITYHDVPSEPTAAKGWRCELIPNSPNLRRVKAGRVPGMFGFPDLYITNLDFVIRGDWPAKLAMVTIYLERPMKPTEQKSFRRQAVDQASTFLARQIP